MSAAPRNNPVTFTSPPSIGGAIVTCAVLWGLLVGGGNGLASTVALAAAQPPEVAANSGESLAILEERQFRQAAATIAPSVVRIDTIGGLERVSEVLTGEGPTTGLIVRPEGWILTSTFNFAATPSSILVTLADGRRFPAVRYGTDEVRKLTLLKIDAQGLPVPAVAQNAEVRVGQWSIAVGRAYVTETVNVSVGLVSATGRIWGKAVQTDAKISPMNYGGPLVDLAGRVMGILVPLSPDDDNTVAGVDWYDSGIGFAVPLAATLERLEQLQAGNDLAAGKLGLTLNDAGNMNAAAVLSVVRPGSPAAQAGLLADDRLKQLGDTEIERVADLRLALGTRYAGETLAVVVDRSGQEVRSEIVLVAELPAYQQPLLGVRLQRVAGAEPESSGDAVPAIVQMVLPETPAAAAGLVPGDTLTRVGTTEISTTETLRHALQALVPGDLIALTWLRDGAEMNAEVTLAARRIDLPATVTTDAYVPAPAKDFQIETGRVVVPLTGGEDEVTVCIPAGYDGKYPHGILFCLAGQGSPPDAEWYRELSVEAALRSMLVAWPTREGGERFTVADQPYLVACVDHLRQKYRIDEERIAVLGLSDAVRLTLGLSEANTNLFRGVALLGGLVDVEPQPTNSEFPQQYLLFTSQSADNDIAVSRLRTQATDSGIPVTIVANTEFAATSVVPPLFRWLDLLDLY